MHKPTATITIDFANRSAFIPRLENLLKFQVAACEAELKEREARLVELKAKYRWYRPSTWFYQPDAHDLNVSRWFYEEPQRETKKHLKALSSGNWATYSIPVNDYNQLLAAIQRAENP